MTKGLARVFCQIVGKIISIPTTWNSGFLATFQKYFYFEKKKKTSYSKLRRPTFNITSAICSWFVFPQATKSRLTVCLLNILQYLSKPSNDYLKQPSCVIFPIRLKRWFYVILTSSNALTTTSTFFFLLFWMPGLSLSLSLSFSLSLFLSLSLSGPFCRCFQTLRVSWTIYNI